MKVSSRVLRYPLLIIAAVFLCAAVLAGGCAAGTSDVSTTASVPSDTVTITSVNDLIAFQKSVNNGTFCCGTVKLMADLNLSGTKWSPIGTIDHPFEGTFDGNGHTISGLNIKSDGTYIGFFGYAYRSDIKNLTLKDVKVTGEVDVGGMVGWLDGGSLTNCSISGSVDAGKNGFYTGGLVGYSSGVIGNCSASCTVNGNYVVGGLVGEEYGGVSDCQADGTTSGGIFVGGLVGSAYNDVSKCKTSGTVKSELGFAGGLVGIQERGSISASSSSCEVFASGSYAGGLVGEAFGAVTGCSATGTVHASSDYSGGLAGAALGPVTLCFANNTVDSIGDYAGGLLGMAAGDVSSSAAAGPVSGGMFVGGLIGYQSDGSVSNCHCSGDVTGKTVAGGLIGYSFGDVSKCYVTGSVSAVDDAGGLVGEGWGHVSSCLVLSQNIQTQGKLVNRISGYPAVISGEKIYAWDGVKVNGQTVSESDANGINVSSSKLWTTLNFWQDLFGKDNFSYADGQGKVWVIIKPQDASDSTWNLPYLAGLGAPSENNAKKILYLKPDTPISSEEQQPSKPTQPTATAAGTSPAPFIGILAGLAGAGFLLTRLRR